MRHLIKALVLPTFKYGTENWGGDSKTSHWKVFEKDVKIRMMSRVKVRSLTNYHVFMAQFREFLIDLYALEYIMGFPQRRALLSPSWLIDKATPLSRHLAKQGFNTLHKSTTMWKTSWGISHQDTHDNPAASKTTYDDIKEEARLAPP